VTRARERDRVRGELWICLLRLGIRVFSSRAAFQSDSVRLLFFLFCFGVAFAVHGLQVSERAEVR
jgi:hypothetical protein